MTNYWLLSLANGTQPRHSRVPSGRWESKPKADEGGRNNARRKVNRSLFCRCSWLLLCKRDAARINCGHRPYYALKSQPVLTCKRSLQFTHTVYLCVQLILAINNDSPSTVLSDWVFVMVIQCSRIELLTAVLLKIEVFWDMTRCRFVFTDVSQEFAASSFRVQYRGRKLIVNVGNYHSTWRHIP